MRQCRFCINPANSREHIWSDWILERLRKGDKAISGHISGKAKYWQGRKPGLRVRGVCETCNLGWMSRLEHVNSPSLGCLMSDLALPALNPTQQTSITRWAVMKAMTMECSTAKNRKLFYTRHECEALHLSSAIPAKTFVWLARYSGHLNLTFIGTDVWDQEPERPEVLHGFVSTISFGYLAMQVVTFHTVQRHGPIIAPKTIAPWGKLLLQIWPNPRASASWPPDLSFSDTGSFGLGDLIWRWADNPAPNSPE